MNASISGVTSSWTTLHSYLIPISMYVPLELQKFPASQFFRWDLKLYDAERDVPAR